MIAQTDINGRLRLFRYGLIVVVIVTFLVSLIVPYAMSSGLPGVTITTFIGQALITTVVVGVVMGILYFVYRSFLTRTPKA